MAHDFLSAALPSGWKEGDKDGRKCDGGGGWGEDEGEKVEGRREGRLGGVELHMAYAQVEEGLSDLGTGEQRGQSLWGRG